MVKEAVHKAIDMLLDLKQKQANIVEAEFSRKQSEDTAKQSDTKAKWRYCEAEWHDHGVHSGDNT